MTTKQRAHSAVLNAVKAGELSTISTQSCELCGASATYYHHESYAPEDWLNVVPLCTKCHAKRHTRYKGNEITVREFKKSKGTTIYLCNRNTLNVLRKLAKYERRSVANMMEKLVLDEWYRLPQEVRAEIEWEQFHEGDPGGHG